MDEEMGNDEAVTDHARGAGHSQAGAGMLASSWGKVRPFVILSGLERGRVARC